MTRLFRPFTWVACLLWAVLFVGPLGNLMYDELWKQPNPVVINFFMMHWAWVLGALVFVGGLAAVVHFLEKIRSTQNLPTPVSEQAEEHYAPAGDINSGPGTVRIYTLGPHGNYSRFGGLSWTTEYARAKERWDAFWKSHLASQAGSATSPADYLSRYRALHPHSSIGSWAGGNSPSLETTSHIPPPARLLSKRIDDRLLQSRPLRIDDLHKGVLTADIEGFDEQGIGFKDICKDQLLDYCPPVPEVRRF